VPAAAVGGGEEAVLAGQRQGPDGALDAVGVDLDAAIVEEAAKARPAGRTRRGSTSGVPYYGLAKRAARG